MRIDILTLFPEIFQVTLGASILGRAASEHRVSYHVHDIRAYAENKHAKVDDRPFGGGPGMVLMCQPLLGRAQHVGGEVEQAGVCAFSVARWLGRLRGGARAIQSF